MKYKLIRKILAGSLSVVMSFNVFFPAAFAEKTPLHVLLEDKEHAPSLEDVERMVSEHPEWLRAYDGDVNPFVLAVKLGRSDIVSFLLSKGAFRCAGMDTALETGNLEIVKLMLDNGAGTISAVWDAAGAGKLDILKLLLKYGGDKTDALFCAVEGGQLEVVKYLLEDEEASVKRTDLDLHELLNIAVENSQLEVVKYLLEYKGIDVKRTDLDLHQLLNKAIKMHQLNIVQYLVGGEGDYTLGYVKSDKTPLYLAIENGCLDVLQYFMEDLHVNLDRSARGLFNAYVTAVRHGYLGVIKYLIEHDYVSSASFSGECNSQGIFNLTVYWAAQHGCLGVIKYMVENHGAGCNCIYNIGTPLYWAVFGGYFEMVRYFVETVHVKFDTGVRCPSILKIAKTRGQSEIADYLAVHGATE